MTHKEEAIVAEIENKCDGHGAWFEVRLPLDLVPQEILESLRYEAQYQNTLYVDTLYVKDGKLVVSLCTGSIRLAQVDGYWNPGREDTKYHVVVRQELESDGEPNLNHLKL